MSATVAERIELCKNCDRLNSLKFCQECGCFMPAKVRIRASSCPLGKWTPVVVVNDPNAAHKPSYPPPNDGRRYRWDAEARKWNPEPEQESGNSSV